jgi:predicted site-specific integrase-resolvase
MSIETPYREKDAARVLGVSVSTLARWRRQGLLHAIKISHTIFYPASEIRRFSGVPAPQPAVDYKVRACGPDA